MSLGSQESSVSFGHFLVLLLFPPYLKPSPAKRIPNLKKERLLYSGSEREDEDDGSEREDEDDDDKLGCSDEPTFGSFGS